MNSIYILIFIILAILIGFSIKKHYKKLLIIVGVITVLFAVGMIYNFIIKDNKENQKIIELDNSTKEAIKLFEQKINNNSSDTVKYNGVEILGIIEIPSLNLKYPIFGLSSTSPLSLLYGSLNETGNAVIDGLNTKDGKYFSNLKNINKNDTIFITDNSGEKLQYIVYDIYEIDISESARTYENENRIITLTTTNDKGTHKIVIKARNN